MTTFGDELFDQGVRDAESVARGKALHPSTYETDGVVIDAAARFRDPSTCLPGEHLWMPDDLSDSEDGSYRQTEVCMSCGRTRTRI